MQTLLPPWRADAETAAEAAMARLGAVSVEIGTLKDPARCPTPFLPWLAWELSVDDWEPSAPEEVKRGIIAASIDVHRKKGTVGSIRRALEAAGWGSAEIIEGYGFTYDGSLTYDGSEPYKGPDHWAEYRVILARPMTLAQADQVRRLLATVAPARCSLRALTFTAVAHTYSGVIAFDGTYTYGEA